MVAITSSPAADPQPATIGSSDHGKPQSAPEPPLADQRSRILQAVLDVVAKHGYAEARTADIFLNAGISSKTFYKHFADKQEAFQAALLLKARDVLVITRAASESVRPWPRRVHTSLQALIDYLVANPTTARLGIVEIQSAGPEAVAEFQRWLRRYADSLAPRASDAIASAVHRVGVADQIAGAIAQLLYDKVVAEELDQLPRLLPDLAEISLAPYIGPHQAAAFVSMLGAQPTST